MKHARRIWSAPPVVAEPVEEEEIKEEQIKETSTPKKAKKPRKKAR